MNKIFPVLLVGLILVGFVTKDAMRVVPQDSFSTGEVLKYKVHYGLINAAEAVIDVAPDIHRINNRPCYKANVFGRTTGVFDLYSLRVRDTWRSYIDTAAIVPQRFHRNIEEGRYRKKENVTFDHYRNLAVVESKRTETFKIPDNVQDIVSGFYYLRTLNLDKYKNGDQIHLQGFFDDEVFNFTIVYRGRTTVETKAGTFRAFKLVPKMPENKLFSGEDAVTVYLSDDRNKIPLMIEAEMFVGSIKVNLYQANGLKYRLNQIKS